MKAIVTLRDGSIHTYGNIMGISSDGESCFLNVGYAIDAKVYSKIYHTGEWSNVVIDATALTDYNLPQKPY